MNQLKQFAAMSTIALVVFMAQATVLLIIIKLLGLPIK